MRSVCLHHPRDTRIQVATVSNVQGPQSVELNSACLPTDLCVKEGFTPGITRLLHGQHDLYNIAVRPIRRF